MLMYLEKSREAGRRRGMAFTLVELLVVVAIIALLVGILVPSVGMAIKEAANIRTSARVAELVGGCNIYHNANEYYPGQRYSDQLGSNGDDKFTGSQWLAKSLFYDSDASPKYPQPKYCPVKPSEDLVTPTHPDGGFNIGTIFDRNTAGREFMAILYFPARLGATGLGQYRMSDNSDYKNDGGNIEWLSVEAEGDGTDTDQDAFEKYIKDRRFKGDDSKMPYNPGAFLIIAAGRDRIYGTNDDICYPDFKSD